jgi:hypothetical protein
VQLEQNFGYLAHSITAGAENHALVSPGPRPRRVQESHIANNAAVELQHAPFATFVFCAFDGDEEVRQTRDWSFQLYFVITIKMFGTGKKEKSFLRRLKSKI